jgi:hypothetical protein
VAKDRRAINALLRLCSGDCCSVRCWDPPSGPIFLDRRAGAVDGDADSRVMPSSAQLAPRAALLHATVDEVLRAQCPICHGRLVRPRSNEGKEERAVSPRPAPGRSRGRGGDNEPDCNLLLTPLWTVGLTTGNQRHDLGLKIPVSAVQLRPWALEFQRYQGLSERHAVPHAPGVRPRLLRMCYAGPGRAAAGRPAPAADGQQHVPAPRR